MPERYLGISQAITEEVINHYATHPVCVGSLQFIYGRFKIYIGITFKPIHFALLPQIWFDFGFVFSDVNNFSL